MDSCLQCGVQYLDTLPPANPRYPRLLAGVQTMLSVAANGNAGAINIVVTAAFLGRAVGSRGLCRLATGAPIYSLRHHALRDEVHRR